MLDHTGLITRFGQAEIDMIADWNDDGVTDTDVIERAIADAVQLAEGYCASRFSLPLTPYPTMLDQLVADIVFYKLHRHLAPDGVKTRHDDAMKRLQDIAAGRLLLPCTPMSSGGSTEPTSAASDVLFVEGRRTAF